MSDNFNDKVEDAKAKATETMNEAKVKAKEASAKVNEKIKGLAFRGMVEKKVPAETRAKFPILNTLIPLTNFIVCGLVVLLLIVVISSIGGGGGSGGSSILSDTSWGYENRVPGLGSGVTLLDFSKNSVTMTSFSYIFGVEGEKTIVKGTYKVSGDNNVTITFPDKKLEGTFTKTSLTVDGKRYELQ